jgi:hypothetical protein
VAYWAPYKLGHSLPLNYFLIFKFYLLNRHFQLNIENAFTDLLPVNDGVSQGSVLCLLLYLLYTSDLPTSPDTITATSADDTAVLATDNDPTIASHKLKTSFLPIQHWLTKWRLKANGSKLNYVTYTTRRVTCRPVNIYNKQLPQAEKVKYLGLHLDRQLTRHKHIFAKRKHLGIALTKLY